MGSTASAADRAPPLLESEAAPPTSRPSATESTALMASSQQPEGKGGKAKKVSYDAIEGLRPILMVMVMLAHYNPTRAAVDRLNAGSMQPPSVTSMWWDTLFDRGAFAVDTFFVISGFLFYGHARWRAVLTSKRVGQPVSSLDVADGVRQPEPFLILVLP